MKNSETDGGDTTVTAFAYKNYGVRTNRYGYFVYWDRTEEPFAHTKD